MENHFKKYSKSAYKQGLKLYFFCACAKFHDTNFLYSSIQLHRLDVTQYSCYNTDDWILGRRGRMHVTQLGTSELTYSKLKYLVWHIMCAGGTGSLSKVGMGVSSCVRVCVVILCAARHLTYPASWKALNGRGNRYSSYIHQRNALVSSVQSWTTRLICPNIVHAQVKVKNHIS